MLRYHLYNIGYKYKNEFGNVNDSLDFENLLRDSPVQNVKKDLSSTIGHPKHNQRI